MLTPHGFARVAIHAYESVRLLNDRTYREQLWKPPDATVEEAENSPDVSKALEKFAETSLQYAGLTCPKGLIRYKVTMPLRVTPSCLLCSYYSRQEQQLRVIVDDAKCPRDESYGKWLVFLYLHELAHACFHLLRILRRRRDGDNPVLPREEVEASTWAGIVLSLIHI